MEVTNDTLPGFMLIALGLCMVTIASILFLAFGAPTGIITVGKLSSPCVLTLGCISTCIGIVYVRIYSTSATSHYKDRKGSVLPSTYCDVRKNYLDVTKTLLNAAALADVISDNESHTINETPTVSAIEESVHQREESCVE